MLLLGIIMYSFILISLFIFEKRISLMFIFVVVSILFVLGHHIIYFFTKGDNMELYLIMDLGISMDVYYHTLIFILKCLLFLVCSYMWFSIYNIKFKFRRKSNLIISKCNIKKINTILKYTGIIILIVSLPFTLVYLFQNASETISMGYLGRMNQEISARNYIAIISNFFPIGLYMIFVSDYENKKMRRLVMFFVILYAGLYLMTGSRMIIIKIVAFFCAVYIYKLKSINYRKILKYCIYGYILLVILVSTSYFRSNLYTNQNFLIYIIQNNPIFLFLRETGVTFTTIANVIKNCPSVVEPIYGKTYINQFLVVIPNLFFDRNPFLVTLNEVFNPLYYYGGLSSSIFAELYYNFTGFGYLYMICFGFVFAKITHVLRITNNSLYFLIAAYVFSELLFSVRYDTLLIFRSVILYILLPYGAVYLFLSLKKGVN